MVEDDVKAGDILVDPEGHEYKILTFTSDKEPVVKDFYNDRTLVLHPDLKYPRPPYGYYRKK